MNAKTNLLLIAGLLAIAPANAPAEVITQLQFQDGTSYYTGGPTYAGTQDTYISAINTTFNYGTSPTLEIADRSSDRDALIRFNMTGVPATVPLAGVTSASLKFTTSAAASYTGNNTYDLFLVADGDKGWLEGSVSGATPPPGTGATYTHEIHSTTAWAGGNSRTPVALTTSGVVGTQIASIAFGGSLPAAGTTFTFSITDPAALALIDTWVAGGANGGFVIVGRGGDVSTDGPQWFVDSREAVIIANRPQLTLNGKFSTAPVLAAYDFENADGLNSVDSDPNSFAGAIVGGSGIGSFAVQLDRGEQNVPAFVPGTNDQSVFFTLADAALGNAAAARAANDYFTFTLTANPNQRLDLDLLDFRTALSNITGLSRTWTLDYSIDGGLFVNDFATGTFTGPQTTATNNLLWTPFTVDLTAPQFDNISSITLRFVQYGTTNSTHAGFFDKIQVSGQTFAVAEVPEPSSSMLFVIGAIALFVWRIRAASTSPVA